MAEDALFPSYFRSDLDSLSNTWRWKNKNENICMQYAVSNPSWRSSLLLNSLHVVYFGFPFLPPPQPIWSTILTTTTTWSRHPAALTNSFIPLRFRLKLTAAKRRCAIHIVLSSSARAGLNSFTMADPLQEPALATPPGVVSQFPTTHSNDQAWYYVGVVLAAFVPGCLLVLRLYTKVYVIRKVDVTDCMTPASIYIVAPILTSL